MKILIAGGAGFIGSHLTKFHLSKNDDVTVIDNYLTGNKKNLPSESEGLKIIEANITDFNFAGLPSFDIIYDLASPASPKDFQHLSIEIIKSICCIIAAVSIKRPWELSKSDPKS